MEAKQRKAEYLLFLGTAALLFLVYAPSLFVPYAKLDTISIYADVQFGELRTWTGWVSIQGRPLASLLIDIFYSLADNIADLRWIRLIGFVGTLTTAFALLYCLRKQGMASFPRVILTLWICTVPAMVTFTVWTTCFSYSWAVAIAVLGGWLCVSGDNSNWVSRRRWAGAFLIFVSLWFYQPSALFALIPLALYVIQLRGHWISVLKRGFISCVWVNISLPLYFVVYKGIFLRLMPQLPLLEDLYTDRLDPTENLVQQLRVVFGTAIPDALSGWFYFVSPILEVAVTILIAGIILARILLLPRPKDAKVQMIKGGLLAGIVLVSLIPVLYLSTGIPWPRMMGAFSGIVLLCFVISLSDLLDGKWLRTGKALFVGLLLMHLAAAIYAINIYWVQQSKVEIAAFREHLSGLENRPHSLVLIDSEQWAWDGEKLHYIYGYVSTNQMWVMEPLMRLLLAEKYDKDYAKSVLFFSSPVDINPPYTHVSDANRILFGQPAKKTQGTLEWNGFDGLTLLKLENPWTAPQWWSSPWYASPWFGIFRGDPDNPETILYHALFGKLQYGWDWENGILHLNLPEMNWSTTTPNTFPLMRRSSDGTEFILEVSDDGSIQYTVKS